MKRVWTKEMVARLLKEYKSTPVDILAFKLDVSPCALKSKARVLGIKKRKGVWTAKEDRLLKKLYPDHTMQEMQERFGGRSASSIYQRAKKLGLEKTKEHLARFGHMVAKHPKAVAARFKKGIAPPNKGKREWEFRSEKAIEKCRATQFKAGHRPHNTRPVGYESVRQGYVYIKVPDCKRMVLKHRYLWEKHFGPIPEGHCVAFIDGNQRNCELTNLMLITEAEKATRVTASMTPEQHRARIDKAQATRNKSIRRDRIRLHWGLEPKTKLVKHW